MKRAILNGIRHSAKKRSNRGSLKRWIIIGVATCVGLFAVFAALVVSLVVWLWPSVETRQALGDGFTSLPGIEVVIPDGLAACYGAVANFNSVEGVSAIQQNCPSMPPQLEQLITQAKASCTDGASTLCTATLEATKQASAQWISQELGPAASYLQILTNWWNSLLNSFILGESSPQIRQPDEK